MIAVMPVKSDDNSNDDNKIILIKRKYSCELPSCGQPQDCKTESLHKICGYHHIDYGVIQGFPRKEKKP